jgi:hypothetical protein
MAIRQLKLDTVTNMFGTDVKLVNNDKSISFNVGERIDFDPKKKLSKKITTPGYLFRSPKLKPENLSEIWPTVSSFDNNAQFTANIDTETKEVTAYMKIVNKSDATIFAFSHSLFEKWSEEKEVAEIEKKKQKKKKNKLIVNADGTMQVQVEVETLDTPDPQ